MYSLLETAKLNGVEPYAYLRDIRERLPTARARDLDALLPWHWRPLPRPAGEIALTR